MRPPPNYIASMIHLLEYPFGTEPGGRLLVHKYRLDNGLNVLLCPDPTAPMIAVQTWLSVGSRHEHAGKSGLAHFFEHLMFNQSEHLAQGEFDRRLEAMGADTNAATWFDWTYYRENIPCEELDQVLALEAERFAHLVVDEPQVESERQVVASERRAHVEDDVDGFLDEQLYSLAYTVHPYRSPTIGRMNDILGFTCEDARSFYRTYYTPNNATLILVGGFDNDKAVAGIERSYGGLARQDIPAEASVIEPEQETERRAHFVKDVAADHLLLGWHGCGLGHAHHPVLQVAAEMLAGGPSSRLHRRLVVEEEVTAGVDMDMPQLRDPGLIELRVNLQRGRTAAEVETMIVEELARLAHEGPDEDELERARCRLETSHWRSLRHPEGKARAFGHYEATSGDFRQLFELAERIPRIGAAEVRQIVDQYLTPRRCSIVVATPRC